MRDAEIEEMFVALGPISIRRMFGGKGIYHDGVIVAVELDGDIHLKGDDATAPAFDEAGAKRWTYEGRNGRQVMMPYWSIPDEALDDPDAMARWVRLAAEAGRRGSARTRARGVVRSPQKDVDS